MRTGWTLTAATHRKGGSQGEQTREARLRGLLDCGETCARPEMRLTVRFILWKMEVLNVYEKTAFYHSTVLLLLATGTLVLCKHHAERTGLACMDIDL